MIMLPLAPAAIHGTLKTKLRGRKFSVFFPLFRIRKYRTEATKTQSLHYLNKNENKAWILYNRYLNHSFKKNYTINLINIRLVDSFLGELEMKKTESKCEFVVTFCFLHCLTHRCSLIYGLNFQINIFRNA